MNPLTSLTQINLNDLSASFGSQNQPALDAALRRLFRAPAEKFARRMLSLDAQVGQIGLPRAAQAALREYAHGLQIFGAENIPTQGAALFLSNHPGMVDTLALFCALRRADLKIIALERPFLQALPNISQSLLYINETPAGRLRAVRQAAAHLKAGGAALTFPAGKIDPDPAVYPGAREALRDWSDSAAMLLRLAPETRVVPVLVRGVLWDKAVRHPLTRLKKTREEREKLGAALQLLMHILFDLQPLNVQVQIAPPLCLAELGDSAALHPALLGRIEALLQEIPPAP